MEVTMVKKTLLSGASCKKCAETEALLRRRGLWSMIDRVIIADEGQPASEGMALARELGVERAPFFVVRDGSAAPRVYVSALKLIKDVLKPRSIAASGAAPAERPSGESVAHMLAGRPADDAHPEELIDWALDRFGDRVAIAFSGAEDVVNIDLAARTGRPFRVFTLDTGRLHPETYRTLEEVRSHYGVAVETVSPDAQELSAFVRAKGLFSFYEDGHHGCCGVRKIAPLQRALGGLSAWITGQRADQSPATRSGIAVVAEDPRFSTATSPLIKLNPLARWTSRQVWDHIRTYEVPYNPLHDRGFRSIGCAPCTRAVNPGQHEREGRWWWEDATKRECGLHLDVT